MVITNTDYGTVIVGVVKRWKKGSGSASEKLTILTIDNYEGTEEKILCWNSDFENGSQLSDRVRKLKEGDIITARVEYDIGDPSKSVCYEMKKTGIFKLTREEKSYCVLSGTIAKINRSEKVTSVWVPAYLYSDGKIITNWYRIKFWNPEKVVDLKKGQFLVVRGHALKESEYNSNKYMEMTGSKFIYLKNKE